MVEADSIDIFKENCTLEILYEDITPQTYCQNDPAYKFAFLEI